MPSCCRHCGAMIDTSRAGPCPQCGQEPVSAPVAAAYPSSRPQPPGAVVSLVLGILALASGCAIILGPLAWYYGHQGRKAWAAAPGAYQNNSLATAGWVMGIIATVLGALSLIGAGLWMLVVFGAMGALTSMP